MSSKDSLVVLITGCSSGIGRSLTEELANKGHRVFATARKISSIEDLKSNNVFVLDLDVTKADSISAAVEAVIAKAGRIDMLINNAGFGLMGPLADVPLDDFRLELETNVVGPLALIQAVLPSMVKHGSGRIVNVGSIVGVVATPFAGSYCASKAAINSISDTMRMELSPFNIKVISLQPGGVKSKFGENANKVLEKSIREDSIYKRFIPFIRKRAGMGQVQAMDTDEFARRVVAEITAANPAPVIRLGTNATKLTLADRFLPIALMDRMLKKKFGLA